MPNDDGAALWRDALRRVLRSAMPDGLKVLYLALWELNDSQIGPMCISVAEVARRIGADRKTVRERFGRLHRDWRLVEPLADQPRGQLNFNLYRPLVGIKDSHSIVAADPQCRLALASESCPGSGAADSRGEDEWGIEGLQSPIVQTPKTPGKTGKPPIPAPDLGDSRSSIPHSLNVKEEKILNLNASMKEPSLNVDIESDTARRFSEGELLGVARRAVERAPAPIDDANRERFKADMMRLFPGTDDSFPALVYDAILAGRIEKQRFYALSRMALRRKAQGTLRNAGGWLRRCIENEWGGGWCGTRPRESAQT